MKPAAILYELQELRDTWRKQSFSYTLEQQKQFDKLMSLRRERVKWFYDNDKVAKPGSKVKEIKEVKEINN